MVDRLSRAERSFLMSKIQAKNSKPEILVRSIAHRLGYRFRLHRRDLPGTPDITFPKLNKVIFVHGCYWHRHEKCRFAYSPKSNIEFWNEKFFRNVERDKKNVKELMEIGVSVLIIWECETADIEKLNKKILSFLSI